MDTFWREGYVGNAAQLFSLRRVELKEGRAGGSTVIEVQTAGGLWADILPDAGLDIGQVRFRGVNMTYLSKNGYDSARTFLPYETEFVHTFPGGMLYTCGLRSAGPANRDGDEWHPLHGRYHGLSAEHVSTDIENGVMRIRGTLRETALFGHVLEVRRTITIPCFGAEITVEDTVENLTARSEEIMQIYHCNFGYPLLSEKAELILPPDRKTVPRTDFAATGLDRQCRFDAPVPGEEERVFFQLMSEPRAILKNPALGMQAEITWSGDTLPILSQWRSMAAGDYVLGLEPTNCYIMGRHDERENGTLPVLEAFSCRTNTVRIAFSDIEQ